MRVMHMSSAFHSLPPSRSRTSRLAVPAHGEIVGLLSLHLMDGIEDHHALGDFGGIVLEAAWCRRGPARCEGSWWASAHLLDDR